MWRVNSLEPGAGEKRLLALETATDACSVALWDGDRIVHRFELAPRRHTERVLPMCEELLEEAGLSLNGLDGIAFGRGPGSFTGVRIAAGITQGLAYAGGCPVIPVSTLAVMAQRAIEEHRCERVLVAMDARMNEVYWGAFVRGETGLAAPADLERVSAPERVPRPEGAPWYGVGDGWSAYGDLLDEAVGAVVPVRDATLLPHARHIVPLALQSLCRGEAPKAPFEALPVYLRDRVVKRQV